MVDVGTDMPAWELEGRDWPNREHSRFVRASGFTWHVQQWGQGPVLLALHGTGAATHTWRDLGTALAPHFTVFALDLPGHGFTEAPASSRFTLPGISMAVAELLEAEGVQPDIAVGHSAGAAILCRMALDRQISPKLIVSLNGALRPFDGVGGRIYAWAARFTAALNTLAAQLISTRAQDLQTIRSLVENTGSQLDQRGLRLYQRLVRRSGHVASAMSMMAGWDLWGLEQELAGLPTELLLVTGARDAAVPSAQAHHLAARLSQARVQVMPDVGHLSHEERPAETAHLIVEAASRAGIWPNRAPADRAFAD